MRVDAATAAPPLSADTYAAIDRYLQDEIRALGIPGAEVAIVEGDKVTHLAAFGVADGSGRPLTPQTPILLASTSKAITALTVMQQVDAGHLDLGAPVRQYLPWFRVADAEASARITVRMLLNQTSGLSTRDGVAYQAADDRGPGALERGVRRLAGAILVDVPGATYHYSNANYDTLGLLVETESGQPFADYVRDHVFVPLEMRHSYATVAGAQADGLADGFYAWFGSVWRPTSMPLPATGTPSATMFSSVEDLSHELIAHLNGGRYGSTQIVSVQAMSALHTPTSVVDDFHGYAMGWVARPLWEALDTNAPASGGYRLPVLLEHGGSWPNSHTYVGFVPDQGIGVALLVNGNDPAAESRLTNIDQNLLRLLNGRKPSPAFVTEELLLQFDWLVGLGLLGAELVSLIWSVRLLRRWGRTKSGPSLRRLGAAVAIPLLLDLGALWLALAYAPEHFNTSVEQIVREAPDVALSLVPTVGLAAIWGPARTVLLLLRGRRARRGRVRPAEPPLPVAAPG